MSTVYAGSHAASPAKPRWTKKRVKKVAFLSTVVALVAAPALAWATVGLFGYGSIDAAAATTQGLTVNNNSAQLTGKLVPGATVGSKATVTNPNTFPVKVTGVVVHVETMQVVPDSAVCNQTVHPLGTATAWPGAGGGSGLLQTVAKQVTIPPGQTAVIEVPQAVRQDPAAAVLCGLKADFAVRAQAGN